MKRVFLISLALVLMGAGCDYQVVKTSDFTTLNNRVSALEDKSKNNSTDEQIFDRKIKCQDMVDKFKKRYNNTVGGSYNIFTNSCDIKHLDSGEVNTDNMEMLQDNK